MKYLNLNSILEKQIFKYLDTSVEAFLLTFLAMYTSTIYLCISSQGYMNIFNAFWISTFLWLLNVNWSV